MNLAGNTETVFVVRIYSVRTFVTISKIPDVQQNVIHKWDRLCGSERNSLDYAGFAQLCGRSPIMPRIMRAHNRIIQRSLVSLRCNLHTATVPPSSHNQRHVIIGNQWYQLLELIPINSNSGLHSCISISLKLKLTENKFITTLCKLYTSTTALHKQTCRHGTILGIR